MISAIMLRQKRIVNSSLYYYKKSLTSFNVRSFHLTYSSLLRRVPSSSSKRSSEIKPVPEEPNVAGSFVAQPLKSSFNNFYGIESDEGVIHVTNSSSSKSSHNSFINAFSSKKLPEKFKRTSFGKVRLDKENKVIFHGQFEESISTSDELEVSRNTSLRNIAIEKSNTNSSSLIKETQVPPKNIQYPTSRNFDDVVHQTETHAKISEIDVDTMQNRKETNDSLIDQLYFPDKLRQDQKIDDAQMKNSSKDSNLIEEYYFNNDVNNNMEKSVKTNNDGRFEQLDNETHHNSLSYTISEQKPSSTTRESALKFTPSINPEESINFIPQMHFNQEVEENDTATKKDSYFSKEGNLSFIDECFFKNKIESCPEHFIETLSSPNTISSQDHGIDHKIHQINNESKPDNKSNTKLNVQSAEFVEDIKSNWIADTKILNPTALNEYAEDNSSNFHSASKNPSNFIYKDTLKKSLASIKIQERTQNKSLSKDHQNINKVIDESTRKQETKIVKIGEKEQNKNIQLDQSETAFDFVKKLRGDQKSTYHESLSGFKTAPTEKFDSKGFRILKSQVPELKYYTRDEMLELLIKNVLYSDDDVVVLNKPYNLVIHESKTTKDTCLSKYLDDFAGLLDKNTKNPKLLTVHRLDKETTGCLLLARNEVSAQRLKGLFAQRKIAKTYWIVTIRVPDPLQGVIDIPISEGFIEKKARMVLHPNLPKDIAYRNHSKRGKNAVTHYNVVSQCGNAALVEVKPETGIKHQIRVHFGLGLGCPILGDNKYSYPDKFVPQKLSSDMLNRLHVQQSKVRHIPMHIYARSVFIPQYTTARNLFVVAPMPAHMSKNLQRLKFRKN